MNTLNIESFNIDIKAATGDIINQFNETKYYNIVECYIDVNEGMIYITVFQGQQLCRIPQLQILCIVFGSVIGDFFAASHQTRRIANHAGNFLFTSW